MLWFLVVEDLQFYRSIPIIYGGRGLRYTIHNQIDVQPDGAFIDCVNYTGVKYELKLDFDMVIFEILITDAIKIRNYIIYLHDR